MKRPPLNKSIIKLLKDAKEKHGEAKWYKKVQFYEKLEDYSPETVGRSLRTLAEEGTLQVGYYNGKYAKGLAMYKLN